MPRKRSYTTSNTNRSKPANRADEEYTRTILFSLSRGLHQVYTVCFKLMLPLSHWSYRNVVTSIWNILYMKLIPIENVPDALLGICVTCNIKSYRIRQTFTWKRDIRLLIIYVTDACRGIAREHWNIFQNPHVKTYPKCVYGKPSSRSVFSFILYTLQQQFWAK
jgi:hypothetical protein